MEQRLLDLPVLYLSKYILEHKREYYEGLRQVTEQASWENWTFYMLRAVQETAQVTSSLIDTLLGLMEQAASRFREQHRGIYSKELFEAVFSNAYSRTHLLESALDISRPTAASYLKKLSAAGILREQKIGRDVYYINDQMVRALRSGGQAPL